MRILVRVIFRSQFPRILENKIASFIYLGVGQIGITFMCKFLLMNLYKYFPLSKIMALPIQKKKKKKLLKRISLYLFSDESKLFGILFFLKKKNYLIFLKNKKKSFSYLKFVLGRKRLLLKRFSPYISTCKINHEVLLSAQ